MSEQDSGIRADWASKDFYKELGVPKTATADEIKKAYRRLARANHPDSHPDDAAKHEKFKKVAEAYDVIGDPEKRKRYDQARELFASGGFPAGGGAGFGVNIDDLLRDGGFGDLFGDFLGFGGGGRRQAQRPVRGGDLETTATVGFVEALEGVTVSLRITADSACPTCSGTGGKPGTSPHRCQTCDGTGFVVASVGGAFSMNETCPACGGRQLVYDDPCPTCHGTGRGRSTRTIQAKVPAGVKDGQRIRLRGKGAPGERGGPAGDLYVTVKVAPHRVFGRKGERRGEGPDTRRRPGDAADPRRHPQRPHLPGARQGCPAPRRHPRRPAGDRRGPGARQPQRGRAQGARAVRRGHRPRAAPG
jgi:molecular chaperone DnaJ